MYLYIHKKIIIVNDIDFKVQTILYIYIYIIIIIVNDIRFKVQTIVFMWVPVSLTSKISDSWIRYLGFNSHIHKKPIDVLIW